MKEKMNTIVSGIVCVKNREATIENALKSLKRAGISEIIVVDGGSTDGTLPLVQKYTNNIYYDEGKGLGHARQIGAEKTHTKYILYLDSDAELSSPDSVEQMLADLNTFSVSGVQAQLIDPRKNKTYWEEGENFHRIIRFNKPGKYIHSDTIISLLLREIVLKYKFDDYFTFVEDYDFFYRVTKDGHKFAVSHAIGYHYHRSSRSDFIRQRIWYGQGNARMIAKHKTPYPLILPLLILGYGVSLCISKNRLKYLPFYLVWSLSLYYGTLTRLFD